jgi:chlorite dismutase
MTTQPIAHPPETLEGWFALHQIFRFKQPKLGAARLAGMVKGAAKERAPKKMPAEKARAKKTAPLEGWSCFVRLIGSSADLMAIHFRDSLDSIAVAQDDLARSQLGGVLDPAYTFLSVAEAGLYHLTAELARAAASRGGKVGDDEYARALAERAKA